MLDREPNTQYVQNLIDLSKRGRKNSFIELCQMNYQSIYALSSLVFIDEEYAADITKRIFINAWESMADARRDIPFNVWMHGIGVFTVMDEFRNLGKKDKKGKDDQVNYEFERTPLLKLFATFSIRERIIYVLKELEFYTYAEIADIFGDSNIDEIKSEFRKIRQILIEGLTD